MERLNDEEVQVSTHPQMSEQFFNDKFLGDYLQYPQVVIPDFYEQWTQRDPKYFKQVSQQIGGVRCLRQDPWECTLSFICSSNNNIQRIMQLVHKLRTNYGSKLEDIPEQTIKDIAVESQVKGKSEAASSDDQHLFPTLKQLEKATEQELRDLGFGYRAGFIVKSVQIIKENGGEEWLRAMRADKSLKDSERIDNIREKLVSLRGVGRKVADCIMLFSMDCPSVIPVDTHVFQLAKRFGFVKSSATSVNEKLHREIGEAFVRVYGEHAGWAHQILFAGDLKVFQKKHAENQEKEAVSSLKKRSRSEMEGSGTKKLETKPE
uniref:DNA-(apurinic or apyrimidinic site) lyase n=1 Tax=Strombidium rassoulzadegani TaxID=1082188 RepID=A0A7S3CP34_9SPIT|mmetsp:Transcript_17399/g.29280  ORF Transcript_17399/g.29280 Transcript_17399/m.29280 type:complete len:320 (+) Transcript_17399:161-1120(+)